MQQYKRYNLDEINPVFAQVILIKENKEHYKAYESSVLKVLGKTVLSVVSVEVGPQAAFEKAGEMNKATLKALANQQTKQH